MELDILKLDETYRKILHEAAVKAVLSFINLNHDYKFHNYSTLWFNALYRENKEELFILSNEVPYDYDFYILEISPIIKLHLEDLKTPHRTVFGQRKTNRNVLSSVVRDFINKSSRLYMSGKPFRRFDNVIPEPRTSCSISCEHCGEREFSKEKENETVITCINCGTNKEVPSLKTTYGDARRMNVGLKDATNNKRNHFIGCFERYQGKPCNISPEDMKRIEAQIEQYGLVDHDSSSREQQFRRVTREHLRIILKDLNLLKDYGESIISLHRQLIGLGPHNIDHLKDKIIKDFDMFEDLFCRKFPHADKKTFKYQQLLYQLLRRHGHKCNPADFNFLKSSERKVENDITYNTVFKELGWNYTALF